ncbi:hypothetical protein ACSVIJ_04055 [Pseudomonas sp. NCHU5208]|uniref:hypothetical protein n=1 Tax=unclassified Pseudomonas TaxID=196821 RepID=UPI003F955586
MTKPLDAARQWVTDESPSEEEIQQSVDNLCHLYAGPPAGMGHEDILAAMSYLMNLLGKPMDEIVVPERKSTLSLDSGPLIDFQDATQGESSAESLEERRVRFEALRMELKAPF